MSSPNLRRPPYRSYSPVQDFDQEPELERVTVKGDRSPSRSESYDFVQSESPTRTLRNASPEPSNTKRFSEDSPPSPSYLYGSGRPSSPLRNDSASLSDTGFSKNHWSSPDLASSLHNFEHAYESYDTRNASKSYLAFADGDVPKNKFSKLYHYLLDLSIVTRWFLYIVPLLAFLWIPGILGKTEYPNTTIWGVKLLWWSIWLSNVWLGLWGSFAVARLIPYVARRTIGVVAVGLRKYIDWFAILHRYVGLGLWTLVIWISFMPLVYGQQVSNTTNSNSNVIHLLNKLFVSLIMCSGILCAEKFFIQGIAQKFHERSYEDRIVKHKFAVHSLIALYRYSSDIPGRSDTLRAPKSGQRSSKDKSAILQQAIKGVKIATTAALGNVTSEILGSSALQPTSPQAVVKTALESANKTRRLARRLFYSYVRPGRTYLVINDILRCFESREVAEVVFALLDKDSNGDITRDELDNTLQDIHREQISLIHSMRDVDSAVGRLDSIFMTIYVFVATIIIAVALEAQLATLIMGAGTLVLGLSWLIGSSCQEVLTSIIFLFVKHPFDVGDRITMSLTNLQFTSQTYTVKEIRLLSTVLVDSNNTVVQAPSTVLNTLFIQNIRRSPQMKESFSFDVAYKTTFDQLEALRDKMLAFLQVENRDFFPSFDVTIVDMPNQEHLALRADIKYKSNWQQNHIYNMRRNKWICALKAALAEVKIYGPKGDPDSLPHAAPYTQMPWDQYEKETKELEESRQREKDSLDRTLKNASGGWNIEDRKSPELIDIFSDSESTASWSLRRVPDGLPRTDALRQRQVQIAPVRPPHQRASESIEMQMNPVKP